MLSLSSAIIVAGQAASGTGVVGHAAGVWSIETWQALPVAAVGVAYAVRARSLAAAGRGLRRSRPIVFAAGLAILLAALSTPLDRLAERLFSAHMVQHLAIGDLAAVCLVLGISGPLLRPLLAMRAASALRPFFHPLVALPLWIANLYLWHLPVLYEAALHHEVVHALQHACFLAAGVALWAAVLEPLPGPAWFTVGWKLGVLASAQVAQVALGSVFLWAGELFYPTYATGARIAGISPHADLALGGAVMLAEATVVMAIAFTWAFFALLSEGERRQLLLEQGASARVAERSARYRREMPPQAGARSVSRPGAASVSLGSETATRRDR